MATPKKRGRPKGSANKRTNPTIQEKDETIYLTCPTCQESKIYSKYTFSFYKTDNPLYGNGFIPFCKECMKNLFIDNYELTGNYETALYVCCMRFDIPFSKKHFDFAVTEFEKKKEKRESEGKDVDYSGVFATYMKNINSFGKDDVGVNFDCIKLIEAKTNNKTKKTIEEEVELTESDLISIEEVIALVGYDPFAGSSKFDQKFLYNELIPYLDEDTLEDPFKLSQIFQVINNNNQIRKMDLIISQMGKDLSASVENANAIQVQLRNKYQVVQANDKIAKENGISVKNRKGASLNKSTLTGMMSYYRDLNLDDIEVDYYDQITSVGLQRVADVSHKAIFEQGLFGDNEFEEMLMYSREMVKEFERKVLDLEEENRKLRLEIADKGGA